jgi:hypothetical protein
VPTTAIPSSSVISTLPAAQSEMKLILTQDIQGKTGQKLSFSQLFAEHALPLAKEQADATNAAEGEQQGGLAAAQSFPELNKAAVTGEQIQPVPALKSSRITGDQASSTLETALSQPESFQQPVKGETKEDLSPSVSAQKSEKKQLLHSSQVVTSSTVSSFLQHDTLIAPQKDERPGEGMGSVFIQVSTSSMLKTSPVKAVVPLVYVKPAISSPISGFPAQLPVSGERSLQLPSAARDIATTSSAMSQVEEVSNHSAITAPTAKQAVPDESASHQPPALEGILVAQPAQDAQEASMPESSAPVSGLGKTLKDISGSARLEDTRNGAHVPGQASVQMPSASGLPHSSLDGERSAAASNIPDNHQPAGLNHFERDGGGAVSKDVNPYQRLDQASEPVVLRADSNRVTVGVHDTSLGWVEIKAQGSIGQISASLVAASSQTHSSLANQLPALTQFLSERHVRVDHLGVEQNLEGGRGQSGRQEAEGQANQGESGGAENAERSKSNDVVSSPIMLPGRIASGEAVFPDGTPLSYISVRA